MVILRPLRDQSKKMRISAGIVITSIVDIDFVEKHIDLNVEFIMKWTDELIDIKSGMKDKERHQLFISVFFFLYFLIEGYTEGFIHNLVTRSLCLQHEEV